MSRLKLAWGAWSYNGGKAIIGGVAAAGSAWMGTAMAHAISDTIPVLDWRALWAVILTSSLTNLFFFLKQSPLPAIEPDNNDNTGVK